MQAAISELHSLKRQPGSMHPPPMNAPIAQLTTWLKKKRESGHRSDAHSSAQVRSTGKPPPPPPKEMQPSRHVMPSPHERSSHIPQSVWQVMHVSFMVVSHTMLPQKEHTPQSVRQLLQSSVPRHRPSPHPSQAPQSPGQVKQVSPAVASHLRSPHVTHAPQSAGHVKQSSAGATQKPFSHVSQLPQSPGHVEQLSVG